MCYRCNGFVSGSNTFLLDIGNAPMAWYFVLFVFPFYSSKSKLLRDAVYKTIVLQSKEVPSKITNNCIQSWPVYMSFHIDLPWKIIHVKI